MQLLSTNYCVPHCHGSVISMLSSLMLLGNNINKSAQVNLTKNLYNADKLLELQDSFYLHPWDSMQSWSITARLKVLLQFKRQGSFSPNVHNFNALKNFVVHIIITSRNMDVGIATKSTSLTTLINFCRAMLCISAAIAGMRCPSICQSVCHVRELRQN